jgi:hypothetical protein
MPRLVRPLPHFSKLLELQLGAPACNHTLAHTPMCAGPPASNGETGAPGAKLGSWLDSAIA